MSLTEEEKKRIVEEEKLRKAMQGKNVFVAVFLSCIIPGLGDLYCGSWIKALIFFGLVSISFIFMLFMGLGILLYIPVWFCGVISAWLSASKSEKRRIKKVDNSLTQEA